MKYGFKFTCTEVLDDESDEVETYDGPSDNSDTYVDYEEKNYKQKILNMWYSKIQFIFHTKGSHESYENQKNIYKSTKGI